MCAIRRSGKKGDTYYMIQGARTKNDVGQALIFESSDKVNWKFRSRVESEKPFGYMWECPDYFETDGTKILSASVQGLEGGEWDDRNVYQSGYFLVDGDILGSYKLSPYHLWDYGFDYYAPQSFEAEDGRRIHISWMGMPDCEEYTNPTIKDGYVPAATARVSTRPRWAPCQTSASWPSDSRAGAFPADRGRPAPCSSLVRGVARCGC